MPDIYMCVCKCGFMRVSTGCRGCGFVRGVKWMTRVVLCEFKLDDKCGVLCECKLDDS